ncbi:uncharacterized protein GGS22DRAFT_185671 [Annulohypoxylon maeteangense]|uniref:uncharacterized protein n=1 Tax=Annulohypoxylon maeteangense TaxID=1927788 RepID=UPI0020089155|nr:uncharacterized protein GGS22DRAFT_185671 [Annulohypoxylon maeteangense]KAI0888292.1 hypothetical protein GGS22DRAFT_185671 [Annulohypoxylon maeteangense]
MENLDINKVNYDGEEIRLEVSVNNEGLPKAADDLKVRKFHGHRKHAPPPLIIDDTVVIEELSFLHRLSMKLSRPGFDWGIGCFGNLSKIVETGKNECGDLYWFDLVEIITAKELFEGKQTWDNDDAWIIFVRSAQEKEDRKSEVELAKFHGVELENEKEGEQIHVRPRNSDADRFLAMLDDMEAAFQEGVEARTIPTSVEYPRWVALNFRDWIEEADFIEANVTAPGGSRYYTSSDTNDM